MTRTETKERRRRTFGEGAPSARVVVAYVVCAVAWGTTWYAIRRSLPGFPPAPGVAIRFLMAAAVLWVALLAARRVDLAALRKRWPVVAAGGLLNAAGYVLVYEAETHITGALAAVVFTTMPLVVGLLAVAFRVERVRPRQFVGAAVGLGGVALLFRGELASGGTASVQGIALGLGSVVCAAGHSILIKKWAPDVGAVAVTTVFATVTGAAILLGWPLFFPAQTVRLAAGPTAALVYLAIAGTVLPFAAYFYLLRRVRVLTVATLTFVTPVVALLVDAVGGERTPPLGALAGGVVVLAGVALTLERAPTEAQRGLRDSP